jgi:protein-S-isoprenylcysteine O-methyltransferase Ste14
MLLLVLLIAWPASEIVLGIVRRKGESAAEIRDRGSFRMLWVTIAIAVTAAVFLQFVRAGRMAASHRALHLVATGLLVAGLAIRWTAILTLGRFFSTNVAIQDGHTIIRRGLYRRVRHPSYSGLLLAFAGLGVTFGSWFSLAAVMIPVLTAVLYRVRVEEDALVETFGSEYLEYRRRSWCLIPWIY